MASSTEENYLKSLYSLAAEKGEVTLSELAARLQVSLPTANSMVKTLQKNGWVMYEKYKPVGLTEEGRKTAALIIRKHRLTEMFLVQVMNFGWEEVHEVAEQIEHIIAPKFFERMDQMLGFPTLDPHGSPIPDSDGKITQLSYASLSAAKPGQQVRLEALTNSSAEFLEYLNQRNLSLGTQMKVISREIYDKSMVVSYLNHPMETLSEKISKRLLVKVIE
jgi:DtxR family transcriptional regulator, Mn-dependent transcriptional regulator